MRFQAAVQHRKKKAYVPDSVRLGAGVLCIFYGAFILLATLCFAGGVLHASHSHEAQPRHHHPVEAAAETGHQHTDSTTPSPSPLPDICGCTLRGLTSTVLSAPLDVLALETLPKSLAWHVPDRIPNTPPITPLSIRAPPVLFS